MTEKPQWMVEHELADAAAFKELNEKLDAHMRQLEPYIQGAAGLGFLWKVFVGIAAAVVTVMQVWGAIKGSN